MKKKITIITLSTFEQTKLTQKPGGSSSFLGVTKVIIKGVKIKKNIDLTVSLTCNFVSDQLARLDLPNAREKRPDFFLGHGLGEVIDDEIRLGLFLAPADISAAAAILLIHHVRVKTIRHHFGLLVDLLSLINNRGDGFSFSN